MSKRYRLTIGLCSQPTTYAISSPSGDQIPATAPAGSFVNGRTSEPSTFARWIWVSEESASNTSNRIVCPSGETW
jgi:hypothetical protein